MITEEMLVKALPPKHRHRINDDLMASINNTLSDPDMYETYRENFLSYLNVLGDGRFKIYDYVNAVKYVSQKLMGKTNESAYMSTFPDRYADMHSRGLTAKEMSSIISVYNKSKLVNLISEQTMIPTWVLNQDLYQKAINVQADLMMTAMSEKVRSDAANSLLVHLKPPEVKKVELDIGLKSDKGIDEMRTMLATLSAKQKELIDGGVVNTKEVAEMKLVGETYEEQE